MTKQGTWTGALLSASLLLASHIGAQAQTPPVPQKYQGIYNELSTAWTNYETQINSLWNGQPRATMFSSEASYSSINLGPQLWTPSNIANAKLELDRQAEMGITMAMFSVHFPYLYEPYFTANPQIPNDYQNYVNFYTTMAAYARSKGMKIAVETQDVFSQNDPTGTVAAYYASLTWDEFIQGRTQTALNIAAAMQPDFMALTQEPDTEVMLTGFQQMNTISGIVQLVQPMAQSLRAAYPSIKLGAGSGTWFRGLYNLVPAMCQIPQIDYYNVHQYPTSGTTPGDFLQNLLHTIYVAHTYNKPVAIGEMWPYKESTTEYGSGITPFNVFRRNPYSFWAPIDQQAIRCMMKTAYWGNMPFMSTYWTQYHFAYIPYNSQTANLTYSQILTLSGNQSLKAMNADVFSDTGTTYIGYINGTIPLE